MEPRFSGSSCSMPGTPTPRLPSLNVQTLRNVRSVSAPPDFRVNDHVERLIQAFQYYYTAHPITLCTEDSPVVMRDVQRTLQALPKRVIAPDGFIPNSVVRTMLTPVTPPLPYSRTPPTDLASQRLNLEQLVQRYLSDERTKDTLSSITFLKDVALLRIATSATGMERLRGEIMTNLAIEVEGLLEQPCEQILEEDHVEDDEAARMEKTAKLHKFARQITKQTVQKHFEQKVQETLERRNIGQKDEGDEEEEPFGDEEEKTETQDHSGGRSGRTPINWRQEEDLIDRLGKNEEEEVQRRMQVERERVLPYDFVLNTLDKLAAEWGGMSHVMATIQGALRKKQQQIDHLDSVLKSRECRVGLLNSIVSPPWVFLYLSLILGSPRTLMEHLENLLDPHTSADILNGIRMQLMGYLGPAQRLDQFLQEFAASKQVLEEILVSRGMPKDAAKNLIYEALSDNPDAKSRITQWVNAPDPEELIQAVKSCSRDKLQAIAGALAMTRRLEMLPPGTDNTLERTKESADASLLAQLDVDVKRVMQYDGGELEEPEEPEAAEPATTQLKVQLAKPRKLDTPKRKTNIFTSPSSSDLSGSMVESPEDLKQSKKTAPKVMRKEPGSRPSKKLVQEEREELADYYEREKEVEAPVKPPVERATERKDTYDDFARAAGSMEEVAGSRQLQARARTVPTGAAKHAKRVSKKPKRGVEEEDEQGTEAPETAESFEEKSHEGSEEEVSEEENLEFLDDEEIELDLAAVENELLAMEEETEEFVKGLAEIDETIPDVTFLKSGEEVSKVETDRPDSAFQRGEVKRFVANLGNPEKLYLSEEVKQSPSSLEDYLTELDKATWFTSKGPRMKKEAVVVDILHAFPQIAKLDNLRAAEIALVLLKRQYRVRDSCVKHVLKVMNVLFFKYLNLLKLARKPKQGSRSELFVRALATLSVTANYEEDVTEKLDMLQHGYKQEPDETHMKPRRSRVDKKRHPKPTSRESERSIGPGTKLGGISFRQDEELITPGEEQMGSVEEEELLRAKRQEELDNKLRMKARERQAAMRMVSKRAVKVSSESEETQSALSLIEQGEGEQEEGAEGETEEQKASQYDLIRRKRKALEDHESEYSISEGSGVHRIEEEVSVAALEAKRRRAKQQKELDEQSDISKTQRRSAGGRKGSSELPKSPRQQQLEKLQAKMRRGLPAETSRKLRHLMVEEGGEYIEEEEQLLAEYEELEESSQESEYEEMQAEEPEEMDEQLVAARPEKNKEVDRRPRKAKLPKPTHREKRPTDSKPTEGRPTDTGMLIRFPAQKSIPRDQASAILKAFLEKEMPKEGQVATPSISLRALAKALQDPNKTEQTQQLMQAFEQALGLDQKDPSQVMEEIKLRLDAAPSSKMDPFNKMVNILSIVMALDSETTEHVKLDIGQVTEAVVQQADVIRQRKEILSTLVDDITSQLKYEYAILNDLAPGQRSVWMSLDTQADTMRECCEKIAYLVSTNAMTSELASFITSVFTMDLLDIDSMLRQDSNLTESEQKVIYRQAKDIQEVLSWFNVKPTGVNQTLEEFSYLMQHEPILDEPPVNTYQLDVILPTSYLNRAGNELLSDFTTIQFVDNEPRAPLEEIYTEAPIEKKMPTRERFPDYGKTLVDEKARKSSEPSRSILKLMTEKLSEIKRTFEDPLRDQESALSRLGTKLLDGWKRMTEKTKEAAETKAEEEEEEEPEGQQEVVAYETGRIAITARTVTEESRKKLRQKPVKRPKISESPSDRVVIAPTLDEDMEKHASKRTHTPRELMLIKPPYADVLTMLPGVKKTTTKRVHDIVGSSAPYAVVTNLTSPRVSPKLPGIASTPIPRTRGTRRRDPFATPSAMVIREQKLDEHVRSVAWAVKQIPTSKKTKRKTPVKDSSIQTISSPKSLSSSGRSVDIHSPMESIMVQPGSVEGREPPFRFMSSLGTPLSSTGAHLGDSTVSEMLKRAVSPGKVRTQTLEVVGEQVDRMSDEPQRLSEIEEITPKATGVWTWLDTLLASQAKSPTWPVQFYETLPPESKYGALRRLHKRGGTGLISRFEEKGAHLQYLVRNLEDTHMLPCSDRDSAPIQIKSTEDEQTKSIQEMHRGGPVFTVASPGMKRAEQIRKRLVEKGMLSPVSGRGARLETEKVARRTSRDSVGINRFATDIEYATKYLQTVFQPGQLTQFLNEIQKGGTSLEALSALEEALIIAANKAEAAEHEEWMHIRGSPRPPGVPPGQWHLLGTTKELNKLQTDNFHQINKGVHCRYALLAQKGFHKQGLSIAAHLARMELVECINKAIQQRAYRRIQTSMKECLKKVIQ